MPRKKNIFTKAVEVPAVALDKTVDTAKNVSGKLPQPHVIQRTKNFWHNLGPGLTTGASDDDPSGIATYSQTGAQFGFQFLWMAIFTYPLMSIVQEMCARIGLVTGRGLAGNIRIHFPRWVIATAAILLFAANAFNIGADLGAMAKAVQLIRPSMNYGVLVIGFTAFSICLQIFTPYEKYAKYLKWLALILLSYIVSAWLANPNWQEVLTRAVVPSFNFNKTQILIVSAILGTTISPYLFFWQTSQEVEEQILKGRTTVLQRQDSNKKEVRQMRVDVWSGMLLSNIVMFFIIAASGGILFPNGVTNIGTAAQAAEALRPFAGDATYWLFAIGIIGTGLLAIPVMAGASSYAFAESFGWQEGLFRNLKQAHAFYGVIIFSMLIGLALNFVGLDPIKALIYAAVGNGIVAPVVLALIVIISSNPKHMGRWVNKKSVTIMGWLITGVMAIVGIAAIISMLS